MNLSLFFLINIILNAFSLSSYLLVSKFRYLTQGKSKFILHNSLVSDSITIKDKIEKGCVLVAKSNEYDHFLIKSVIFIIENGDRGTQGVIVNKVIRNYTILFAIIF